MKNERNIGSPIFITGVYRSGTTLPAQILNNHSKLRITFDSVQFLRFHLGNYNPIKKRYKEIVNEVTDRLNTRYSLNIPKQKILDKLKTMDEINYENVYSTIMRESFCEGREDLRWGEKSVLEWTKIPTFLTLYPNGKTIHLIRDPRDVLASYREMTIEPKYRYLDAAFTCLHSMNWIATIGKSLPKENYYLLKHEDLITDPEKIVNKLCVFLDIEYEDNMLNTSSFTNRNKREAWKGNTAFDDIKKGISIKSKHRWKTNLKKHEIAFVESIVGLDLLERFGYEPSCIEFKVDDLQELLIYIRKTPLIQNRLLNWFITGEGIESYPSDPNNPANWAKKT